MGVCLFESIRSFESTAGVRISTVRIVPTPLFKVNTPLSPHRSSLRNEIVNQSELSLYSPLKKAADVYANQNGDRPPQSQQTNGWKKNLLLQCSVHLRVIITRSTGYLRSLRAHNYCDIQLIITNFCIILPLSQCTPDKNVTPRQ